MMVQRRPRTAIRIAALLLLISAAAARAEDPAALLARLKTADSGSALDVPDVKPWHLKMTVQLFDQKGKPNDQGTIEEWWSSPEVDRREYKTSTYAATEIRKNGKLYRTKDAASPPYYLELLREQAVHPMPKTSEIDQSTPELRKVPSGKVVLDCIMLSQPMKQFGLLPLGLFPTYCFDPGKDLLRVSFEFGQQTTLRNALATFQGKTIARDVVVMLEKAQAASSQVVALEKTPASGNEFELSDDEMEQSLGAVRISSGTAAGNVLSRPQPIYPESAKRSHTSGNVVLHARIGTDGRVHALTLVSTPDPDLAIASIAAVRTWTYKPYMLNGVPTEVETTVNVKFTFGP